MLRRNYPRVRLGKIPACCSACQRQVGAEGDEVEIPNQQLGGGILGVESPGDCFLTDISSLTANSTS